MEPTIDINLFLDNMSPTSKILSYVLFFIIVEIIYFIFIRTEHLNKGKGLLKEVLAIKVVSAFLTCFVFVGILMFIWALPLLLTIVGIAGIIALYIAINYFVAKVFGKEETAAEKKQRLKDEDKSYKFKVGQKVKVIDTVNYRQHKYHGKVLKITGRYVDDDQKNSYRTNVGVSFSEARFAAIRTKKKTRKR